MQLSRRAVACALSGLLVLTGWAAPAFSQTTVQYDYDAVGRACRARYSTNETVNYTYDKNGNRSQAVRATSGGATNSTACPQVTGAAGAASADRNRGNHSPTVWWKPKYKICATSSIGGVTCTTPESVNALRFAFDVDLDTITVTSVWFTVGTGTVTVASNGHDVLITPPSGATNNQVAQIAFAVSDGHGGTTYGYIDLVYITS